MKKLIPKEERTSSLIKFGAPKAFVENIGKIPELEFQVEGVEGAYFYLPTISNYKILQGFNVVPIYDEGDSFYILAYNEKISKIIHFELENDEVYDDYKLNWDLLLMDLMTQFYNAEIEDGITINDFERVAKQIDFHKAKELFKLLDIPVEEYYGKYENEEKGKIEIAKELKIL